MYNQNRIINLKKLLGRPYTDTSNDAGLGPTGSSNPQPYRPKASQNTFYPSSAPIACLDRSPNGRLAVLGGRHILKTIHIDELNIKEGIDVRAAIKSQPANKANAASLASEQLSIKDVKIATHHGAEPTIFTACANGKIFTYDVNRLASGLGLEFIQSSEGSRQVNKLDFNPHRGTWLLAGGQDGFVRCFDTRAPVMGRGGPTFRLFQSLRGNDDGIRDLKWAPKDGTAFACATESGAILKWDIRRPTMPLLKINAHDAQKGVSSISWHPDGEHLISAGLDGKCYVWDLSKNAEKRQKAKWTINAPAPVTAISWRPGLWSATAQGRRAAQVAMTYDEGNNQKNGIRSVHIWDLARPTMPYKEIDLFETSPSAVLWHDQDLLWAVGRDGFTQCDVAFAPKIMDRRPLSSLDFSARGEVLMFLEKRIHIPRPRTTVQPDDIPPTPSLSSSPNGQMLSLSRSDSEEDVVGSFLGPKRQLGGRRRGAQRSGQSMSTTPPSGPGVEDQVISLEQAIKLTVPFKPQQVMAIGRVPATNKVDMYHFLSQQYLEILGKDLPNSEDAGPLDGRITGILNKYARAAESANQFRLAQTWRILSYAMNLLLTSRSRYHLQCRLTIAEGNKSPFYRDSDARALSPRVDSSSQLRESGEETPRRLSSIPSVDSRSTLGKLRVVEEIDSDSNVPTPLARPVQDDEIDLEGPSTARKLTPVQEVESFSLPPAIHSARPSPRRRLDSTALSIRSQESQVSSTEGYDFWDVEAVETLPIAINVPKKKEPLRLDSLEPRSPNSRRRPAPRLDSDESFSQMFSLSDTSRQTSLLGTSAREGVQQMASTLQRRESQDSEYEFASRIRGRQIDESSVHRNSPRPRLERLGSDNLTEDFMMSQATTDTLESEPAEFEALRQAMKFRSNPPVPHQPGSQFNQSAPRPQDHTSPTITETDFLPWDNDPPYPYPISFGANSETDTSPIKPYEILSQALEFESRRSALNASAMILLLKPLAPDNIIDSHQASAILRQYHIRLMNMKFFVEAAMLRNLCLRGWPSGIELWGENYSAIFRPAQERVAGGFTCAQCHKPREVRRTSPEASEIWRCERCRALVAPCAVCGHREAASESTSRTTADMGLATASTQPDDPILSTWWYCPGCSHGGHASCLWEWHALIASSQESDLLESRRTELFEDDSPPTNSDGCCPVDGCGHACLPGRWRNESSTARTEELGRAVREQYRGVITDLKKFEPKQKLPRDASVVSTPMGSVKGDTLEIPQSRAVESVREFLAGNTHEKSEKSSGGLMSILSSSPSRNASFVAGSGGVERERRKSVKFAGPADDRR